MTKAQEYKISFHKQTFSADYIYPFATTTNVENSFIAGHISDSVESSTRAQIGSLQDAIDGKKIQEDWGEVMGSQLDIFQKEGTVQVGYTNRRIPIQDFKQLLEEWLVFLHS